MPESINDKVFNALDAWTQLPDMVRIAMEGGEKERLDLIAEIEKTEALMAEISDHFRHESQVWDKRRTGLSEQLRQLAAQFGISGQKDEANGC